MGNNIPGLIAYASVLVGAAATGLWLVALGEGLTSQSVVAGVVALVLLVSGISTLALIHIRRHIDPIEPETTEEEASVYRRQHIR